MKSDRVLHSSMIADDSIVFPIAYQRRNMFTLSILTSTRDPIHPDDWTFRYIGMYPMFDSFVLRYPLGRSSIICSNFAVASMIKLG